jgi:hypothetical protein
MVSHVIVGKTFNRGKIVHFDIAKGQGVMLPNCRKLIFSSSAVVNMCPRLKSPLFLRRDQLTSHNNSIIARQEPLCFPFFQKWRYMSIPTLICTPLSLPNVVVLHNL